MKKRILTGDRPTGLLHLGHYVGSLQNRVLLQDTMEQFIIIADMQAMTDNFDKSDKLKQNIFSIICDYLAVGLDPEKNTFFIQSQIPEISHIALFFMNLVTVARLERNPTVKTEIRQKNFEKTVPVGFFVYPISQAADILSFMPDYVPVGEDQIPMIEQTNEIARTFNHTYSSSLFSDVEAIVPKTARLVGIDGKSKMSKSLNNTIFLSENAKEIKEKVRQMYTDPNHIRVSDPGTVEGNVVFEYLDVFDPFPQEIEELKKQYKKGGLGDSILKARLTTVLEDFIGPIREKRLHYEQQKDFIWDIAQNGTKKARAVVQDTLNKMEKILKIKYF